MSNPLRVTALIVLLLFSSRVKSTNILQPVFDNRTEQLTESGYFKLSWELDTDPDAGVVTEFELQQADDKSFEEAVVVYKGPDFATFISGLDDGIYYYRVRTVIEKDLVSQWSEPVSIRVKHHSRYLALTLFGVGALVFLITVGIVVRGHRTSSTNL